MLFTVRMKRKRLLSKFDASGKKIADETIMVDETYHDLPYATAQGYKAKFPDADVVIEQQAMEINRDPKIRAQGERESRVPRAERAKIGGSGTKIAHDVARQKAKPKTPAPARSGNDMADALNKAMGNA